MLCSDQDCSYQHWIIHTTLDLERKERKYSQSDNSRLLNKKRGAISRLLAEIQQKHGEFTKKIQVETGSDISERGEEHISKDNILIPTDPTSPYAFTLNVGHNPGTKRTDDLDENQVRQQ